MNAVELRAAATSLEQLAAQQPTNAQVWSQRGLVAYLLDEPERACSYLERSVELAPDDADTWSNLGVVQLRLGRVAAAEESQRRAIALRPGHLGALNNLASALLLDERHDEAAPILEALAPQAPHDPNVWVNLGHARNGIKQHTEALAAFDHALALAPGLPTAIFGRGDALQKLEDHVGALACYEQVRQLLPNDAPFFERLSHSNMRLGRTDAVIAACHEALAVDPDTMLSRAILIFAYDLQEGQDQAAWEQRLAWNERVSAKARSLRRPHTNDRSAGRKLRVGYVSADFRQHSAGYAVLPILRSHDHDQLFVVCYSNAETPDSLTDRFRSYADRWHEVVDLSDDELTELIRADQIDILVDLSGHSLGNRLPVFAREPAPVQVTAWGYATGTGLETMHYFLADDVVIPPDARCWYREEIVALPSLLCYEAPAGLPPLAPPPILTRGHVTFGAFNRIEKITPNVRATWAHLMAAVPDARLVLKTANADDRGRQQVVDDLVALGVERGRVIVLPSTPHAEHLAAHSEIDIMLDTFPHGGGVTSIEALLMGAPVVTVAGVRVSGRVAASFLTNLGLTDLIARSAEAYIEIAARLAADPDRLARERATLRERVLASPIGNAERYTRHVEAAYRTMWRRWCAEDLTPGPLPGAGRGSKVLVSPRRKGGRG